MNKSISVIIPNFNGKYLLDIILPTVYVALAKVNISSEIIIVDDASSDDSVIFIEKNYPKIKIIQNHWNVGFSVSVNKGAAAAQYDLLFFLNNDVKLTEDYFISMLPYFDKKDAFGVNGRVIGWEDDKIQDAAKLPYFQGGKLKTSRNYYYKERPSPEVFTFYLTGSNALIDKKKFFEIGGFNEIFSPFYCEDLELSVRAWKSGWKCYYEHNAVCRHKVSATTSTMKRKKYVEIIYNRNKFIFHYLHLSGLRYYLYVLQTLLEAVLKLILLNTKYFQSLYQFIKKITESKKIKKSDNLLDAPKSVEQILNVIEERASQREMIYFKS